jgi:hypothetical protein
MMVSKDTEKEEDRCNSKALAIIGVRGCVISSTFETRLLITVVLCLRSARRGRARVGRDQESSGAGSDSMA